MTSPPTPSALASSPQSSSLSDLGQALLFTNTTLRKLPFSTPQLNTQEPNPFKLLFFLVLVLKHLYPLPHHQKVLTQLTISTHYHLTFTRKRLHSIHDSQIFVSHNAQLHFFITE